MKRKIIIWLLVCVLTLGTVIPAQVQAAEAVSAGDMAELIVEFAGEPLLLAGDTDENRAALEERQDRLLEQICDLPGDGEVQVLGWYTLTLNAVSLYAPRALAERIRALEGVERVREAAHVEAPASSRTDGFETQASRQLGAGITGRMIGLEDAEEQGLDGSGIVIAVIDTGLDLDHPAFSAEGMDEDGARLGIGQVQARLSQLNAARMSRGLQAEQVYHSAKVPFAFNYAESTADVSHTRGGAGDHGTYVAAAAAGVKTDEGVLGVAPGAQLLVMKVFGTRSDSASESSLLAALEDSVALGADIINLSLGTVWGFPDNEELPYARAIQNAVKSGVILCAAAGNNNSSTYGNGSGRGLSGTGNIDIGVINEPASLEGVLSVTSVNSDSIYAAGLYATAEDGSRHFVPVGDTGDQFGLRRFEELLKLPGHRNGVFEYVVVPGLGTEEDFAQVDVRGKIALIHRGEITFVEKSDRAFANGALAVIVYNNTTENISMDMTAVGEGNDIPCVIISQEDGEWMIEAAGSRGIGTLTVLSGITLVKAEDGWQPSDFASWGPLSDLTLKPDVAGVGGKVYSAADGGNYGIMSGTSMSTPQLSGMAALMLQYMRESGKSSGRDAALRVQTILLNTAVPARRDDGVEYSPRKQGAGLANVGSAMSTPVWVSVDGSELPKAELGDDKAHRGVYSFSFTAHNITKTEQVYLLRASVLTETEKDGYMLQQARQAEAETTFSGSRVTAGSEGVQVAVPAGGQTKVQVTIRLSEAEKKALRERFENGVYIEGYVYLDGTGDGMPTLSIPMLAFFGDWSRAPLFEQTSIAEKKTASWRETAVVGSAPYFISVGKDKYLGENPLAQDEVYLPERSNALSVSGKDGSVITGIGLNLLRNARSVKVEILDSGGRVLRTDSKENLVKSGAQGSVPGTLTVFDKHGFTYFDPAQYGLKDGSTFTIQITGEKGTGGAYNTEVMKIPVYIDGTAPEILNAAVDRTESSCKLKVTVKDNCYAAGLTVVSNNGTIMQEFWPVNQKRRSETVTMELDISDMLPYPDNYVTLSVMDYAQNMSLLDVEIG